MKGLSARVMLASRSAADRALANQLYSGAQALFIQPTGDVHSLWGMVSSVFRNQEISL